ncbi:MAG: glycosyltransferase family 2 protein [Flavobacteriales bacterium]|nr:glycosyltransferase family 2 protein [Flavobacteriales bacterium]
MNRTSVSIVIPCYNVEQFVEQAINSAQSQTYSIDQIICVDNESTDSTLDVLNSLKSKFDITIVREQKRGAPAARNTGWRMCDSDWIQFLDADDILNPSKIEHQISLINSSTDVPFVASRTIKRSVETGEEKDWHVHHQPWHGLLQNKLGITSANLYSRRFLDLVNGWKEELESSQEYDLMFRMMRLSDKVIVDNAHPLSIIRSRSEGSISAQNIKENKHRFLRLMSEIGEYLKTEKPEIYSELDDEFFQDMFIRIRLNTIDGGSNSSYFFKQLIPPDFTPKVHEFTPKWFKGIMRIFGFGVADKIQAFRRRF